MDLRSLTQVILFMQTVKKDRASFDARLEFDVKIIPYKSENLNWIEKVLVDMKKCLIDNRIPKEGKRCDY